MEPLADRLAVSFHDGIVVDNNVDLRRTLRIEHPAIIEPAKHLQRMGIDVTVVPSNSQGISTYSKVFRSRRVRTQLSVAGSSSSS